MRRIVPLLFVLCVASSPALAGAGARGKVSEYKESDLTDAERAAAQARAKNKVSVWHEAEPVPAPVEFPWMAVIFTTLVLGIAAPFAWRAYKQTSREISETEAGFSPPQPPARRPRADRETN